MTRTIVVDIGNSAATIASFDPFHAAGPTRIESILHVGDEGDLFETRLAGFAAQDPAAEIGVAAVDPAAQERAVAALRTTHRVRVAPEGFRATVENHCDPPHTVGLDRLFNAEAVARDRAFVIVDAGTAITVDLVDRGRFLGGAIAPGIRMAYGALHRRTSQLPRLEPAASLPAALGTSTRSAIEAGVEVGLAGLIDRLVGDIGRAYDAATLITGGDSTRLLPLLRCAPIHDPHLTLRGIALALTRCSA